MKLFEELKRRNVFRVGAAYALIAWVILQAVDFVLDVISTPNWVIQVFTLAAIAGLPVVLVIAWVYEVTPEGIKRESEIDRSQSITHSTGRKLDRIVIVFLAVAVVFLLAQKFTASPPTGDQPEPSAKPAKTTGQPATQPRPAADEKSIAVLPFVNMSADPDQEYFSDGISEEILNVLTRLPGLKVAGRTSSFSFKGKNEDLRKMGQALGVAYILEGSVRKAGERVRITAQLIKVDDGFHLWSHSFDRELTDVFAVQDEIATDIADALAIKLSLRGDDKPLARVATQNMQAYDRYLEARALIVARSDLDQASRLLTEATDMDPGFAEAWAANAQVQALLLYYGETAPDVALGRAEQYARKTLELDPESSTAHSVMGDIYRDRQQYMQAVRNYQKALELNPSNIEAHEQFAQMLWRLGLFRQALSQSRMAVELDPLSWLNLCVQGALLYQTGQKAEGWETMHRAEEVAGRPRTFLIRHMLLMALSDNRKDVARHVLDVIASGQTENDDNMTPAKRAVIGKMLSLFDSPAQLLSWISEHRDTTLADEVGSVTGIAILLAAYNGDFDLAGELATASTQIPKALLANDFSWYYYAPLRKLLRQKPELAHLFIKNLKVVPFWREYGFADMCEAKGPEDYTCTF